jgi:hypothetical protein
LLKTRAASRLRFRRGEEETAVRTDQPDLFLSEGRETAMKHGMYRMIDCRLAACAALLGLAAALGAQTPAAQTQPAPAPNWQPYSYSTDGFSATFPAQPELSKKDVPTDAGSFELRSYVAEDGQVALFVGVCDYGSETQGKDPDTLLQGAKNGALQSSNSHLTREKPISLGIYHGLEFEAESDAAHFYARIYMVGNTLYQSLVVYPVGQPYADTARFLDSFQLIARTAQ